ncbi:MAG: hypothetical protein VKP72_08830 [bacterium]|nr:hypothetical protein [bacterium]
MAFSRPASPLVASAFALMTALLLSACGQQPASTPASQAGVSASDPSASSRPRSTDPRRSLVEHGLMKASGARRIVDVTLAQASNPKAAGPIAFTAVLVVPEVYPNSRNPYRDVQENWEGTLDLVAGKWKGRYVGSVAGHPEDLPGPGRWIVISLGTAK